MELHGAATAVVMDVVPSRLHVVGVAGEIHCVLLLAGRRHADVRGFVAQKLDGVDLIGGEAAVLAVGGGALEVIAHHSPGGGVGGIHALLAGIEEQPGDSDVIGGNADVWNANAIGNAGGAQGGPGAGIGDKGDGIAGGSAALEFQSGIKVVHGGGGNAVLDVTRIAGTKHSFAAGNGQEWAGKGARIGVFPGGSDEKNLSCRAHSK